MTLYCDDIELHCDPFLNDRTYTECVKTSDIRQSGDRFPCHITGLCILPDGSIVIADHGNAKLTQLKSETLAVSNTCSLNNKPWSVCCINHREVAVSVPERFLIQWIQVRQTSMALVKTLKISHPFKVLTFRDDKFYLAGHGSVVYVYTSTGVPLSHFSCNLQQDDETTYSCTDITLGNTGDILFLAYIDKGLIAVDHNDGTLLWQYGGNSSQNRNIRSVSTAEEGCVYVSICSSNSVHKLDGNGKEMDTISTDAGVLCVDSAHSRLVVAIESSLNVIRL